MPKHGRQDTSRHSHTRSCGMRRCSMTMYGIFFQEVRMPQVVWMMARYRRSWRSWWMTLLEQRSSVGEWRRKFYRTMMRDTLVGSLFILCWLISCTYADEFYRLCLLSVLKVCYLPRLWSPVYALFILHFTEALRRLIDVTEDALDALEERNKYAALHERLKSSESLQSDDSIGETPYRSRPELERIDSIRTTGVDSVYWEDARFQRVRWGWWSDLYNHTLFMSRRPNVLILYVARKCL